MKKNTVMRPFARLLLGLWICLLIMGFTGCGAPGPVSKTDFCLDTVVTITLYNTDDQSILTDCFEQIRRYERLFSRYVPESDISRLNQAKGERVEIAAETAELLRIGIRYGQLSDGAFDITIAPVMDCWDFTGGSGLPETSTLQQAAALVDYTALQVEEEGGRFYAKLNNPEGAVDLGGIAKGYIADRLAGYLRDKGVTSALLDLGGNIYALGSKQGDPFTIGIRDPLDENNLAATVAAQDRSVVTSGIYERGFDENGVRYHHIVHPDTGMPVQNGLASVTIVSEKSVDGDALSTACFVLGREKGLALIEQLEGVEALFIDTSGNQYATSDLFVNNR